MNKLVLTFIGCVMAAQIARAQTNAAPTNASAFQRDLSKIVAQTSVAPAEPKLPRFDVDFPGGPPRSLVTAVEGAMGKPVNVIIPAEADAVRIEPMKLTGVTVPELFEAIGAASHRRVLVNNTYYNVDYSFFNHGNAENPIWVFNSGAQLPDSKMCRFYQLGQELKTYSIEDITTAIQIGWKMLEVKDPPMLKFHPETKLLIAVGPWADLQTIDLVLGELRKAPPESEPRKTRDAAPAK